MYADRDRYVGDPAFVGVPVAGLLDPDYVAARAAIAPGLTGAATGRHAARRRVPRPRRHGRARRAPPTWSSSMRPGNAVSMTTTVESMFGSGRMVGGFFLNNQLTDFSFSPTTADGSAGRQCGGGGQAAALVDVAGHHPGPAGPAWSAPWARPAASSILAYNAKALIGTLDWGLPMQAAFDLPNLVARGPGFGADTVALRPDPDAAAGRARHRAPAQCGGELGPARRDLARAITGTAAPTTGARAWPGRSRPGSGDLQTLREGESESL